MDLQQIINRLYSLKQPNRNLEFEIAKFLGWKTRSESFTSQDGANKERILWLVPDSDAEGNVPRYTLNLEAAYYLAQELAPKQVGGVAWEEDGMGSARIGDGPYIQAASAPIALTIAALQFMQKADRSIS